MRWGITRLKNILGLRMRRGSHDRGLNAAKWKYWVSSVSSADVVEDRLAMKVAVVEVVVEMAAVGDLKLMMRPRTFFSSRSPEKGNFRGFFSPSKSLLQKFATFFLVWCDCSSTTQNHRPPKYSIFTGRHLHRRIGNQTPHIFFLMPLSS